MISSLKKLCRRFYYLSEFKKYTIRVLLSLIVLFVFRIYLGIYYIFLPFTFSIWICLRLCPLVLIQEEIMEKENLSKKEVDLEIYESIGTLVVLLLIFVLATLLK